MSAGLHQRSTPLSRVQDKEGTQLTEDGGLKKLTLKEGTGSFIPKNVTAVVHYIGRLTDGTVFDSSRDRGKPFKFPIGQNHVILGWDKGVATMSKGEVCLLTCRPEYAYGNRAVGPIPANSTLVFEVELLDWEEIVSANQWADRAIYVLTAVVLVMAAFIYISKSGYI